MYTWNSASHTQCSPFTLQFQACLAFFLVFVFMMFATWVGGIIYDKFLAPIAKRFGYELPEPKSKMIGARELTQAELNIAFKDTKLKKDD